MRLPFAPIAIAALFAGALPVSVTAAPLRLGGTGGAIGMLQQLGTAFTANSGIAVVVIPNLGSSGSIRALTEQKLDVVVSGRPLRPAEAAGGLTGAGALRTAYVMATSHPKPNGLKSAELADIYKTASATWSDGTPIRIILRPRSDSDTDLMGELFTGMREAIEVARRRPDVPTAATDQDNADMAERVKGSLTGTTATQIKTENRHLQAVPLDGVAPTFANFESGTYRYTKKLYFIVRAASGPDVTRFVEFVRSPEGLKLLREVEVLPEPQ